MSRLRASQNVNVFLFFVPFSYGIVQTEASATVSVPLLHIFLELLRF